ncbi:LysR family transcriptional regulator [Thalassomonas haliotis]|uniref:LysR family transcriptional regulator n=1 Tax=Thalassomonas haliotis TaxID=485448 RepID=A0ABY7V9B6_9GAMM|nr:LysR family transcriptional regulator [Thalassomonas haliotis]WDE10187.1 LysR family transcriptional regulator [Thalassomonas haliotis]
MNVFDDVPLLRTFVIIVECGSLSAAARRLKTTQPTVSRHLSALEGKVGTTLLQRDTRRMSLTQTGHQVLADAKLIIGLVEESDNRLHAGQAQLTGHIRLFATIDFGQFVVSRMIASFIEANPCITIELTYSNRPVRMIEEGHDVGIIAGNITDESIVAKNIGRVERLIVCSPNFLQDRKIESPADIEFLPWVTLTGSQFSNTNNMMFCNQEGQKQSISVSSVLATEGVTSIREAVRMGLGIALLPTWLIQEDLLSKRLISVLPNWKPQDIPAHVVYPSTPNLAYRLRHLIDYSCEYMAPILRSDR